MLILTLRWVHLVAASTWVGGMIVLAALVIALRRAGASRDLLQAAARGFARVSWTAMAVAIATGVAQVELLTMSWSYPRLHLKLTLVATAVIAAFAHQMLARRLSPRVRGLTEVSLLLLGLAIFAAAVRL